VLASLEELGVGNELEESRRARVPDGDHVVEALLAFPDHGAIDRGVPEDATPDALQDALSDLSVACIRRRVAVAVEVEHHQRTVFGTAGDRLHLGDLLLRGLDGHQFSPGGAGRRSRKAAQISVRV
jgi:hypothetical protein